MLVTLTENGISILDIKYCPHARWEGCLCLKPKTGMVDAILAEHPDLVLKESFLAGDSESDLKLARTLGIRFFKIDSVGSGAPCVPAMPQQELSSIVVRSLKDVPAYLVT